MITKQDITNELKEKLGRDAKPDEENNAETDALLLARICWKKLIEIDNRLKNLEK